VSVTFAGVLHYFDLIVEPLRDAGGTLLGLICSATDITSSKNLIAKLQEALDQINALSGCYPSALHAKESGMSTRPGNLWRVTSRPIPRRNSRTDCAQSTSENSIPTTTANEKGNRSDWSVVREVVEALVTRNFDQRRASSPVKQDTFREATDRISITCRVLGANVSWSDQIRIRTRHRTGMKVPPGKCARRSFLLLSCSDS